MSEISDNIKEIMPDLPTDTNFRLANTEEELIEDCTVNALTSEVKAQLDRKEKYTEKREATLLQRAHKDDPALTAAREKLSAIRKVKSALQTPLEDALDRKDAKLSQRQVNIVQGTSRAEIAGLMEAMNVNLDMQLTKKDTSNLLACLLTCNEGQLDALYANPKVPLAIKTIIKRMIEDARVGSTDMVEKLWDRIFGKNGMNTADTSTADTVAMGGGIPDTPVSREAYIYLRESLLK